MSYFAPFIDEHGLHIPTYSDILEQLINDAKGIFGQDIYLGIDSQDYQWISVVAAKINDSFQMLEMVYNSRSPVTSIGAGLDAVVKINGLSRHKATYSTCILTLTGSAGSVVNNGVAQDRGGYLWNLPASVTIGTSGYVDVKATCQTIGSVQAGAGEIDSIFTPTYGWASVNNVEAAMVGSDVESDSQLRARQAFSTARPSRTVLEGLKGAIADVEGVTRFIVYENDTNAINSYGHPEHSVTCIVEGGLDTDVARAIFERKGPGCYTNGDVIVNVNDAYGQVTPIRFYRPVYVDVDVVVNVKQIDGYTTETTKAIKEALVESLNLSVGEDLSISTLWRGSLEASNLTQKPTYSVTSITFAKHTLAQGVADIVVQFNEAVRGNIDYITLNFV